MIHRLSLIVLVACMLLPFSAGAFAIPQADIVVDQAGVIRDNSIRQNLIEYQKNTGHEIGVLVVKTLDGDPIEYVANEVARAWGIGDEKRDDGVLLLVATDDREVRIEVGYGLEGALPDITAKQIIEQVMIPYFKTADYQGGITAGIDAIQKSIAGEPVFPKGEQGGGTGKINPIYAGMIIWFVMNFFWGLFARSKAWWHGGVVGGIGGLIIGIAIGGVLIAVQTVIAGVIGGLILDYLASHLYKKPPSGGAGGGTGFFGGWSSGGSGFGSGGGSSFGGFGGGSFGGGGSSGRW